MTRIINDATQPKIIGNVYNRAKAPGKNNDGQGLIKNVKNQSDENSLVKTSDTAPSKSTKNIGSDNKIETLEQEAQDIKDNISSITSDIEEINAYIDESENNKTQIGNDILSMQQEYDALIEESNNAENPDEKSALRQQAQNIKKTIELSQKQLKESEEEINSKKEELKKADAELKNNEEKLPQIQKAIEDIKAQTMQKTAEQNKESKDIKEQFGIEENVSYNETVNHDLLSENLTTGISSNEIGNTKEETNILDDKNITQADKKEALPDVSIPESHKGNYYQIYSDMLDGGTAADAADKAAEILMHDSSIMSSQSMKLTPGELKEKLKDIYTKGNSDLLDPSKTGGESIDEIVDAMVDIPIKYGLNAEWFAAKVMTESDLANVNNNVNVNKHNITGWTSGSDSNTGKVIYESFNSITDCLEKTAASLKTGDNYKDAANIKELNGVYNLGYKDAPSEQYTAFELKRMFVLWNYRV